MRYDYHDHVDKVWSQSENGCINVTCISYKTFNYTNICIVKK